MIYRIPFITLLIFQIAGIGSLPCIAQHSYQRVDRLALDTPASAEKSIETLASYFDRDSLSDREKIRAVFRWATDRIEYDIDAYHAHWPSSRTPETVFYNKKALCKGYVALFCRLSEELDIPCKKIEGYARTFNTFTVDTLSNQDKHAWNAVFLEDQWWMSDITWSVGYHNSNTKKVVKEFNDGYFLVQPERFVYTHFPFQSKNQMLDNPVGFKRFTAFPSFGKYFFKYDIHFLNLPAGEISASQKHRLSISKPDSIDIGGLLQPAEHGLNGYYAQTEDIYKKIYSNGLNFELHQSEKQVQIDMIFHEKRKYAMYLFGKAKKESVDAFKPLAIVIINNKKAAPLDRELLKRFPESDR